MTFSASAQGQLYDELISCGYLPEEWRRPFWLAPRHMFVPDAVWRRMDGTVDVPVSKKDDPSAWLSFAYANDVVAIQYNDGASGPLGMPTSTLSMPELVFATLDKSHVHSGHRVLEMGTGSGWTSALLSARLGDDRVTTVEIDEDLAGRARVALAGAGFHPTVITGDGAEGWAPGAPYDRLIATVAIQQVPYPWVEQVRPGGLIITPWTTRLGNGGLLRLTVGADGTASGRFVHDNMSFMRLRSQRGPAGRWLIENTPDELAEPAEMTGRHLWNDFEAEPAARLAVGLLMPDLMMAAYTEKGAAPHLAELWLYTPDDGSVATWSLPDLDVAAYPVRQHGPRRLFDEVERALRWWEGEDCPGFGRFGVTVRPDGQCVELDGAPVGLASTLSPRSG